ncbi:MAG: hypothetical protein RL375_4617, partial [Pseudomonadota bacterium]
LERQQSNLLHWPRRRLMTLNIDAGGAHARRILEKLVAAEQAAQVDQTEARPATA